MVLDFQVVELAGVAELAGRREHLIAAIRPPGQDKQPLLSLAFSFVLCQQQGQVGDTIAVQVAFCSGPDKIGMPKLGGYCKPCLLLRRGAFVCGAHVARTQNGHHSEPWQGRPVQSPHASRRCVRNGLNGTKYRGHGTLLQAARSRGMKPMQGSQTRV